MTAGGHQARVEGPRRALRGARGALRQHRIHICACLAVVAVTATASPAFADNVPPTDALTDKAATLYDEGFAAYKKGKVAEAHASFLAAWSLKKHWQIAASLGDCEVQLGLHREAAEHLAYFLRIAPKERRTAEVQKLYESARSKVATLTVVVDVADADVAVDGKVIGKSPLEDPVFVLPGVHAIEARKGAIVKTVEVDAGRGTARTVELSVAGTPSTKGGAPKRSLVPGIVMAAVGGAAAITGIGLLGGSSAKASSASTLHDAVAGAGRTCTTGAAGYDARCEELASTSKSANTLRDAGVGALIGAGVVGAAAVTYFLWPQDSVRKTTGWSLRAAPTATATGGGVMLMGTF